MSECSEWNRASSQPQVLMQNKECFCFFFFFSILSLNTLVKQAGRKTTKILHLSRHRPAWEGWYTYIIHAFDGGPSL